MVYLWTLPLRKWILQTLFGYSLEGAHFLLFLIIMVWFVYLNALYEPNSACAFLLFVFLKWPTAEVHEYFASLSIVTTAVTGLAESKKKVKDMDRTLVKKVNAPHSNVHKKYLEPITHVCFYKNGFRIENPEFSDIIK